MDNTLVMKVYKPFQNLTDVDRNKTLGELSEPFAYVMK
jgi:hypothetical protein